MQTGFLRRGCEHADVIVRLSTVLIVKLIVHFMKATSPLTFELLLLGLLAFIECFIMLVAERSTTTLAHVRSWL